MKECEVFIGKSQNRLANLEKERAKERDMLDATTARMQRLREFPMQPPPVVSSSVRCGGGDQAFARTGGRVGRDTTQERLRVRRRVSRRVLPIDAKFDPGRALPVDRRSPDRSSGGARRWEFGTSARIDVEDGAAEWSQLFDTNCGLFMRLHFTIGCYDRRQTPRCRHGFQFSGS